MSERAITDLEAGRWRSEFPMLAERIHLANCSHAPQSLRVRAAVDEYLEGWRREGMDWDRWLADVEAAKGEFAGLIGAEPSEVAVSTSASAAVASIASALKADGDRCRVVTTEAEFPTVGHVWLAHVKYGLEVDFVPMRAGAIELEEYARRIDERTLITSATHVDYRTGLRQDVAAIAKRAHAAGSPLLVDAYQSLGTIEIDVKALDVDILVGGALKYLLGIPGIAFLYVRSELHDWLRPALTGWLGQEDPFAFEPGTLRYAAGARRFETGTPPIFAAVAAATGIRIIREVGPGRIERRMRDLAEMAIPLADELGLDYAGPRDVRRKGATLAFRVPEPEAVERRLRDRGIVAAARGDLIRLAPHFFTTVDRLERALHEVGAASIGTDS